jgi:RND family efflux transporter MFP subunit
MKMRAIASLGVFAMALIAAGCSQKNDTPVPIRPVLSTTVAAASSSGTVTIGTIEPRFQTDLAFRVQGRLNSRPVSIGDSVDAGQIVATIDAADLELAVRSARAELSKSQAQLENATAVEQRKRTLIGNAATTQATLDNAEQERALAEASVARTKANLAKAEEQLGYAQLKPEFAGVVTAVGAEAGQVVAPGQNVVTIARPDVREAVVDIGADFPIPLKVDLPFTVGLQLLPAVQASGQIREIAPEADPITRMRRVRIALTDPPESLRLGSTVTARLADAQDACLRVPASAVLANNGESFVWIVSASTSTVSLHKVDLSREEGGFCITDGLSAGTRIVTAGIHSLQQGQLVRIEQDMTP